MSFSPLTVIIIMVLGVLFFGKNLPEIARQIGSALMEFRKGVDEWKDLGKDDRQQTASGNREPVTASPDSGVSPESSEHFESLGTKFVPPEG